MPKTELDQLLVQLEEELGRQQSLDRDTRDKLAELRGRIETTISSGGQESGGEAEEQTLSESMREHVEQFESSYPQLTMLLGRIADVLNKLGI